MRHTPVSTSPARMARSTGAAPRQRGSSEKCTFTIGTCSSTWALMSLPKATTTPSSTPSDRMSSTLLVTGIPAEVAAAATGEGTSAPPRPRFRSGWVTTAAMSWPSPMSASRATTAGAGVPRNARRTRLAGRLDRAAAQLAEGLLALIGLEQLEQQPAIEVVELVLEHAGQQLVGLDRDLVAVEVVTGQVELLGPDDREVQAGHRQAPLLVLPLAPRLGDHRVDDGLGPLVALGKLVDEQALLHADLGRGQAQPRGRPHGVDHVLGQLGHPAVDVGDLGSALLEDGITEHTDGIPGHASSVPAHKRTGSTSIRSRPPDGRGVAARASHSGLVDGARTSQRPSSGPRASTVPGRAATNAGAASPDTTANAA